MLRHSPSLARSAALALVLALTMTAQPRTIASTQAQATPPTLDWPYYGIRQ